MNFPKKVKIVEVGPRDGLQNEIKSVPTDTKIKFINLLSQTGLAAIEVTSFVSAKKIPQLADNSEVLVGIEKKPSVLYSVLTPNLQGFNAALAAGAKAIAVFGAASETFCQKNINCSIEQSLERFSEVIHAAKENNILVRGYISCVFGCPYEGEIAPEKSIAIAEKLLEMGCYEISFGDTIGITSPGKAQKIIRAIIAKIPVDKLALHFHDTYGQAIANIYAALELGISTFDSSVSGLGGCPYAKGATGNVATEDVWYLLNGLNIETGIDLHQLIKASKFISEFLNRPIGSKVAVAQLAKELL